MQLKISLIILLNVSESAFPVTLDDFSSRRIVAYSFITLNDASVSKQYIDTLSLPSQGVIVLNKICTNCSAEDDFLKYHTVSSFGIVTPVVNLPHVSTIVRSFLLKRLFILSSSACDRSLSASAPDIKTTLPL